MEFNNNFFENYLKDAPLPLALERTLECELLSSQTFERPILDIGCGEGLFAKKLFKEKIDVGIDPNPRELARAKQHDAYNELILCKGDNIQKESGSFNTILSNSVLEHIPEIDAVLIEANRLLSSRGRLYLTLPTARFDEYTFIHQLLKKLKLTKLSKYYRLWFNRFWSHYHYYNTQQWIEKFEALGFKVVSFQEYGSKKTCLLNAMATPFSLLPFVTKKLTNQWFMFHRLRQFAVRFLTLSFQKFAISPSVREGEGGLVFFSLMKNPAKSI